MGVLVSNLTAVVTSNDGDDDDEQRLYRCWALQGCDITYLLLLLNSITTNAPSPKQTQSCVPNNHRIIPLLAPAYNKHICPHRSERWEIRTNPLGCHVSTITTLTSIVNILSTLLVVLLVWLAAWAVARLRKRNREKPGWLWNIISSTSRWSEQLTVLRRKLLFQRRKNPDDDDETVEEEARPLL
ncbi:hypothetical protein B0H66DRAFT_596430 [Apodospora peruviana]|uniref:Uncharacterized protein n=1 Tax=Apodospora peruviana TaxID=516989 RepID=A0AAE0IPK9_9PEZI|nr:hypothetical protein B0H66DRAFT_596430 [Apodospora peruviana]